MGSQPTGGELRFSCSSPTQPLQHFHKWLPIPYVNFFVMKSPGSWLAQEAECLPRINKQQFTAKQEQDAYAITINKRKKARIVPGEEQTKEGNLARPIRIYCSGSPEDRSTVYAFGSFRWSWIGTMLRKVTLGGPANKRPCLSSSFQTSPTWLLPQTLPGLPLGCHHCQSSLLPASVPWQNQRKEELGSHFTPVCYDEELGERQNWRVLVKDIREEGWGGWGRTLAWWIQSPALGGGAIYKNTFWRRQLRKRISRDTMKLVLIKTPSLVMATVCLRCHIRL